MSVISFSNKELGCIYTNLMDSITQSTFPMSVDEKMLLPFMVRIGLCNRLAYNYNYHNGKSEAIILKIPIIEKADNTKITLKKLIEKLLLLDYNCVTNSGRCFLDSKDKELLKGLVYHLRLQYIEALERLKR